MTHLKDSPIIAAHLGLHPCRICDLLKTPPGQGTEVRLRESTARVDSSSRRRSAKMRAQWAVSSLGVETRGVISWTLESHPTLKCLDFSRTAPRKFEKNQLQFVCVV